MVVDISAIVANLFDEPKRVRFDRLIEAGPVRLISAATRVEACPVSEGRKRGLGRRLADEFLALGRTDAEPAAR
jgi:uncharacterized protein with PIN domain